MAHFLEKRKKMAISILEITTKITSKKNKERHFIAPVAPSIHG